MLRRYKTATSSGMERFGPLYIAPKLSREPTQSCPHSGSLVAAGLCSCLVAESNLREIRLELVDVVVERGDEGGNVVSEPADLGGRRWPVL